MAITLIDTTCIVCGQDIPAMTRVQYIHDGTLIKTACADHDMTPPAPPVPVAVVDEAAAVVEAAAAKPNVSGNNRRGWDCLLCYQYTNNMRGMAQHYRRHHGGTANIVVEGATAKAVVKSVNVIASPATPNREEAEAVVESINLYGGEPDMSFFNTFGLKMYGVIDRAMHAEPHVPVAIEGPTGHGKSTIVDMVAAGEPWNGKYSVMGTHRQMEVDATVGSMYPVPDPAVLVEWHDGKLTTEVRRGGVYHIEEFSNANDDLFSRFHQVMDEGTRRFLDLIESLERYADVHKDFVFVASYNPPAPGYTTVSIPEPVRRRFGYVVSLTKTLVNEPKLLKTYMPDETVRRVMNLVSELRRNPDTWVCTRDVKLLGQAIANGFEPLDAIEYSLLGKFNATTEVKNAVRSLAAARFNAETTAPSMPSEEDY